MGRAVGFIALPPRPIIASFYEILAGMLKFSNPNNYFIVLKTPGKFSVGWGLWMPIDKRKLNCKASDIVGVILDTLTEVLGRRMLTKLQVSLNNLEQPLHDVLVRYRSTLSTRLILRRSATKHHRKSLLPVSIALYNSSLWLSIYFYIYIQCISKFSIYMKRSQDFVTTYTIHTCKDFKP